MVHIIDGNYYIIRYNERTNKHKHTKITKIIYLLPVNHTQTNNTNTNTHKLQK